MFDNIKWVNAITNTATEGSMVRNTIFAKMRRDANLLVCSPFTSNICIVSLSLSNVIVVIFMLTISHNFLTHLCLPL